MVGLSDLVSIGYESIMFLADETDGWTLQINVGLFPFKSKLS